MEKIMVWFVMSLCFIGIIPIIWIIVYTLSKSINGKEHIEGYMSKKYGNNWFDEIK
jgi:hypothetical protein